ncbi:unnamed protein product, partial [marine sediment metagenome]
MAIYAYVTDYSDSGLYVVNVTNPASMDLDGVLEGWGAPPWLGEAWGVFIDGSYAYIASHDDNSLTIIDISDPTNPAYVGRYSH